MNRRTSIASRCASRAAASDAASLPAASAVQLARSPPLRRNSTPSTRSRFDEKRPRPVPQVGRQEVARRSTTTSSGILLVLGVVTLFGRQPADQRPGRRSCTTATCCDLIKHGRRHDGQELHRGQRSGTATRSRSSATANPTDIKIGSYEVTGKVTAGSRRRRSRPKPNVAFQRQSEADGQPAGRAAGRERHPLRQLRPAQRLAAYMPMLVLTGLFVLFFFYHDAAAGRGRLADGLRPQPRQAVRPGRHRRHVRRRGRHRRGRRRAARGGRVPPHAREVPGPRRPDSQGRAAGRAAGHRQDAAGQGHRRRGGRAVLQPLRLRLRRDVRRRRRRPRPRHVPAGRGQGPLHHLHRRAGRPGQDPRHRASSADTTSASRRSTPCWSRWTASTPTAA